MKVDPVQRLHALVYRFNKDILDLPIPDQPTRLRPDRYFWTLTALAEELEEFVDAKHMEGASTHEILEQEADALIDLTYFALGRLIEMGFVPGALFDEVHEKNMQKVRGEMSKRPGSLGYDAVKPAGWTAPDLMPYLSLTKQDIWKAMKEKAPQAPRIMVMGWGRHGKDTVSEMIRDHYGLKFTSSSEFCAKHIVFPELRQVHGYKTPEECFADRHNHREEWKNIIAEYNELFCLGEEIFKENDIYCGIRTLKELQDCYFRGLYDYSIWVDSSARGIPPEDKSSCDLTAENSRPDFIIENAGTLEDLEVSVCEVMDKILEDHGNK